MGSLTSFSLFILLANASPIREQIKDAARLSTLDPKLVEAIVQVESNFKNGATSKKGAMGLMQVMPQTALECQIHDPYHPLDNLVGACRCLRKLINRYRGNLTLALAAYNAGTRHVDRYKRVPPFRETEQYVEKVLEIYRSLRSR